MPVSTTHVSCGALFGIGIANGQARWQMIRTILLAWVLTLPTAALLVRHELLLFIGKLCLDGYFRPLQMTVASLRRVVNV